MSRTNSFTLSALALTGLSALSLPAAAQTALPPVTVTSTRFSDDADRLPLGVSVITAKDIADTGVSSVNEAIMKLLGVPGRQDFYGGGNYSLDLRGFGQTASSNQVIVVDGQRLNEGDLTEPFLASLPIDDIERIEVLRGSGAVLYGEGATGGVISITTKAAGAGGRRTGGQVYGSLGSDRLREGRGNATLALGDFSLDAAVSRRATANYRDNFASRTEAQSLGAQWRHDAVRVGLAYSHDDLDTGLPGSLSAAQYAANPRQTNTPTDHADIRNDRLTGFAKVVLETWEFALDAGQRHKEVRQASGYNFDVDAENYSLRAKHQSTLGPVHNALVVGADVNNWERLSFGSVSSQYTKGLYLKDDVTLPTGTRVSVGIRKEQIDKTAAFASQLIDDSQKAWELGLVQPVMPGLSAYARLGRSFRLANVDEIGFTQPNVLLRPQTSRDLEAGGRWSMGATRAEARLYRNALTDEIAYDGTVPNPFAFSGFGANVNLDPTQRRGMEIEVAHAWTSTLQTRVNAAVRRATFRAGAHEGKDVPLTPRQSLSLRADWGFLPQQQLSGVLNAVSSQHPDYENTCRMPGYVTADVRYAYQWGAAQWALGVTNALDRKYYTQAYGCASGVTSGIYPEAGRMVNASLRWKF